MEQINERNVSLNGLIFLAGTFIGTVMGIAFGGAGAGTLIGMGVGYIAELVIGSIRTK